MVEERVALALLFEDDFDLFVGSAIFIGNLGLIKKRFLGLNRCDRALAGLGFGLRRGIMEN